MKVVKKTKPRASLLDKTIRRLLISNPSIDIDKCQKIINTLRTKTEEEKELIRASLQESVTLYKEKINDTDSKEHYRDLCTQAKEHIYEWEKVYGKVSLADIISLIDSTEIKLEDVGFSYLSPKMIYDMLNEFVVGQSEYSKKLSLVIYTHMLRTKDASVNMPKANLLVYGPSGVGKTYGIQVLSKKLGIPFGIINSHSVVPQGYVGEKFIDKLTQLYMEYGHLDHAVLFIDEVDKLFNKKGYYDPRLLEELLLLLDDNNIINYPESYKHDADYLQISSKNVTCILGGMFDSLREAAIKRLSLKAMGFRSNETGPVSDSQIYEYVNKEDLKKVLDSDEIYGRIGHFVRVNSLSEEDLADVLLQARDSPLDYFRNYFSHHDVSLTITEEGAAEVAKAAYAQNVGVRGLKSIMWQILEDEMHDIDSGMRLIRIDKRYVQKQLNKEIH